MDRKSARAAGREATAGHFKNVNDAMEAVNRLTPILARAVLAEIACTYPEEVLRVGREIEQEAKGPKCSHSEGLIEEIALLKAEYAQLNDLFRAVEIMREDWRRTR